MTVVTLNLLDSYGAPSTLTMVLLKIFSFSPYKFIKFGYTTGEGTLKFDLDEGVGKFLVYVSSGFDDIEVNSPILIDPSSQTEYDIQIIEQEDPVPEDIDMCRIEGRLIFSDGNPYNGVLRLNPLGLFAADKVSEGRIYIQSVEGDVVAEVAKNVAYQVEIGGMPGYTSLTLPSSEGQFSRVGDFVFPIQERIHYITDNPLNISVGETVQIEFGIIYFSVMGLAYPVMYQVLPDVAMDTELVSSDTNIAEVAITNGYLSITGVSAGSATITARRILGDTAQPAYRIPKDWWFGIGDGLDTVAITGELTVNVS